MLLLLSLAEFMGMALWFSASAVLPLLNQEWSLSESARAWLTMAVQLGFVAGAVVSALLNLPDILPSTAVLAGSAALAALVNAGIPLFADGPRIAVPLRFLTGFFLAGVYPPGLKIMATWFRQNRGLALGALVGALTVGSALPHLVSALGAPQWRRSMLFASGLALLSSALAATAIREGPFRAPSPPFQWRYALQIWRDPALRLTNFGYLGHMWELYAMWTWLPLFLLASFRLNGAVDARVPAGVTAFCAIGIDGLGCIVAGLLADRLGRTATTIVSMITSAVCSILIGVLFGGNSVLVILVSVLWGFAIVADSAQFSTSVTELGDPAYSGTALTTQIAVGFLLTLVSIRLLPVLVRLIGWQYAFAGLAVGPALGSLSMWALRRRPEASKLAGGMR